MSVGTKLKGIRAADGAIQSYNNQQDELFNQREEVRQNKNSVDQQLNEVFTNLGLALIPNFNSVYPSDVGNEIGMIALPGILSDMEAAKKQNETRKHQIEENDLFKDKEMLVHPVTGSCTKKIAEATKHIDNLSDSKDIYEQNKNFQWLYRRKNEPEPKGFTKIIKIIMFTESRKKKHLSAVLEKFEKETITEVFRKYEEYIASIETWSEERDEAVRTISEVDRLVQEYEILNEELLNYESSVVQKLREEVANYFSRCEFFNEIRGQIRKEARIMISTVIALKEKSKYLENMEDFLTKEIIDRQNRSQAISRVAKKWQKNPSGRLTSDKTKWLVDIPQMKARSTAKQVGWIGSMNRGVYHYNDYDRFDRSMDILETVLIYDLFARNAEEKMPYEGFSSQVIEDISTYREDYGEVDYSEIDAVTGEDVSNEEDSNGEDEALAALATEEMDSDDDYEKEITEDEEAEMEDFEDQS
ncbi:MAG: hypothetical protein GY795_43350 [Desulfobacterales bacterium]|nr:hypothetical protein [Desulfobacterales bacterium]